MSTLTLDIANTMLDRALDLARRNGFKPVAVAVLDVRGVLKAFAAEDGTSLKIGDIAIGKAHGAIALGRGSRALGKIATERPHFLAALMHIADGSLVPGPGGVVIRSEHGELLGAVGISGELPENDEALAVAGITACGLVADRGD